MTTLPHDDVNRSLGSGVTSNPLLQQRRGRSNRGKRVPQFMSQSRKKIVLATIGFAQRFFGSLAFGDVVEAIDCARQFSLSVPLWPDIHDHGDPRAIGALDEHLSITYFR